MKVFFFLLVLILKYTQEKDCGINLLCYGGSLFSSGVDAAMEDTINHAKQAGFEIVDKLKQVVDTSMEKLFNEKINPLMENVDHKINNIINNVDYRANQLMEKANNMVMEIIKTTISQIDTLIKDTMKVVNDTVMSLIDKAKTTVDEIIKNVQDSFIKYSFDRFDKIYENISKDLKTTMKSMMEMVDKIACMSVNIQSIYEDIKKIISELIPTPWDPCRKQLDALFPNNLFLIKGVASFSELQSYIFAQCKLLKQVNENSSIEALKIIYTDMLSKAGAMRCLFVTKGVDPSYFHNDISKYMGYLNTLNGIKPDI